MNNLICQSCDLAGDWADFPDPTCPECGGDIVTMEEMAKIRAQRDEVMTRGKLEDEFVDLLKGDTF